MLEVVDRLLPAPNVSTLLEILDKPYAEQPPPYAIELISTLLEILEGVLYVTGGYAINLLFQPFLRFWGPSVPWGR